MFKILYITPHLSTGGAPQYLLRKIKELISHCDIYCVEYDDITGGNLIVQRSQIQELLGNKLFTLDSNKYKLIDIINNIKPDVIHFEELPEYFCDHDIGYKIYNKDRLYKIVETSHDSSFNIDDKIFFPDKFIFVSQYQQQLFSKLNIPSEIVEYPIDYKVKSNRNELLLSLELDPNKLHILNIGLFTPRKNQGEILEYAKKLINFPIQFHFIGNQADNFKDYWEPLMKEFPSNCKWWGERRDVDTFYNAMDVFLFTSKGTNTDKETNPLVIRESIGWNIPLLMYNLQVYMGMYDKYKNITYLTDDFNKNIDVLTSCIDTILYKNMKNINIWFEAPNKIHIENKSESFNGIVSVKDKHTNIPLYFCKFEFKKNFIYYVIPNGHLDFTNESYFSEFLIEIYDDSEHIIHSKTLKLRDLDYIPVNLNKKFSSFDCLYINYKQMFYDDIYSHLNIDNLNNVIDIGANVGLFSLYMLNKRNCKFIHCIEPTKKAHDQLETVLKDEKRCKLHKIAIHNFSGVSKIKSCNDNSTISGFLDNVHPYTKDDLKSEIVNVSTLGIFLKEHSLERIDLIKLDVEGVEYEIIENLSDEDLLKCDKYLIEYHWAISKDINKMVNRFKNLNYNIINEDDPEFKNDLGFFFACK